MMKYLFNPANYSKKQQIVLFCCLSLIFLMINLTSLYLPIKQSAIYDERPYYANGYAFLLGKASEYWNATGMPVQALNPLVSRIIGQDPDPPTILAISEMYKISDKSIFGGKIATIIISLVLGFYVFWWSHQLYGVNAGFLAFSLYIFDPNIIAHSRIVHQNLFETCVIFIAIYYFWNFLKFGGKKNAVLSMLIFGITYITRYSSLYLLPIYLVLVIGFYHQEIIDLLKTKQIKELILKLRQFCLYVTLFGLSAILLINIGFAGEKTFLKLADYEFQSKTLISLQSSPIIKSIPIPLPYAYVRGLNFAKSAQKSGKAGGSYLMGVLSREGFKKYYIVAFLYKVPIATQLLLGMAILSLIKYRKQIKFWENEAFLIVPIIIFFALLSSAKLQLGIRYILMIFPFIFVLCSRLMLNWDIAKLRYRIFILSLLAYLIISNLSYFPHYLSYFNELLVDRRMGYTILADSNLDWGQNKNYVLDYVKKHPDILYSSQVAKLDKLPKDKIFDPKKPQVGKVVIGANELVGIARNPDDFRWIKENLKPIDHIAYSFLIFEIKPQDLEPIRQSLIR